MTGGRLPVAGRLPSQRCNLQLATCFSHWTRAGDCHNLGRPPAAAERERPQRLNLQGDNNEIHLMRLTAAALLGISASAALAAPAFADDVKITIVGVGDIYAFEGGKVRGGFARLNAVAKAEKAANPNTLYVFDGDMISPSLLSGLDQGSQHHPAHQCRAVRPRGAGQPRVRFRARGLPRSRQAVEISVGRDQHRRSRRQADRRASATTR